MMNTAVNPKVIPRITAPAEPITVKKPLTAQAQGISGDASSPTMRKPVGNGIPSSMPKGATSRIAMMTRQVKAKPSAHDRISGIAIRVDKIPATTADKSPHRARQETFRIRPARYEPTPVKISKLARTTEKV